MKIMAVCGSGLGSSFLVEMKAFVDAVLDDAPIPVTGVDGRAAVALGIAARRSYEENRPVRLEEIEGK